MSRKLYPVDIKETPASLKFYEDSADVKRVENFIVGAQVVKVKKTTNIGFKNACYKLTLNNGAKLTIDNEIDVGTCVISLSGWPFALVDAIVKSIEFQDTVFLAGLTTDEGKELIVNGVCLELPNATI